ncbi:MAG: S8 family serine peptidase [Opitutaceae bacterium]
MKPPLRHVVLLASLALSCWLFLRLRHNPTSDLPTATVATPKIAAEKVTGLTELTRVDRSAVEARAQLAGEVLANLQRLLVRRDARPQEGLLTFKDDDAYQRFLARANEAGLTVLDQLNGLRTVRVRYGELGALQRDMLDHSPDYSEVAANFLMNIPQVPSKEDRAAIDQVPFGNRTLEFLGVTGDHSQWGKGTTIAIIDSGVSGDPTFGQGRLRAIDIGLGTTAGSDAESGHGTAVAALAAGFSPDAPGVSPAANLLSVRVTDANGTSDIFTVSRAIQAAVDAGAKIINISLGGYSTNRTLDAAIAYASERGAIIVAAAGNDQAAQLTWPAADPRVVSVGAVDAAGQQVSFSNSGPQLQMAAPGYGVQTAWLNGQRVTVNGTSASAPIVSGAIAAVISENAGFTAQQAWEVLQRTASDSGAPGTDASYGNGILNLGWAMNRNNPTYIDTAVSSHYYDAANNEMDFVVQNRSGQPVGGLQLNVTTSGTATTYSIATLAAGASTVVKVPLDQNAIKANGGITFATQLVNPAGTTDRVPANNRRTSTLTPVAK